MRDGQTAKFQIIRLDYGWLVRVHLPRMAGDIHTIEEFGSKRSLMAYISKTIGDYDATGEAQQG